MTDHRHYSFLDHVCIVIDQALKTLDKDTQTTTKQNPGHEFADVDLMAAEKKHVSGLMRVNHAGEICAQGLYYGQSVVTRNEGMQKYLLAAAKEEGDHLAWCKSRLDELNSHPSYLNPLWYLGSFCIGASAGWVGDQWSLGFIVETEKQVVHHLETHLALLPKKDLRSHAILKKMQADEERHRDEAMGKGANELPGIMRAIMNVVSKIMVKTAYWL